MKVPFSGTVKLNYPEGEIIRFKKKKWVWVFFLGLVFMGFVVFWVFFFVFFFCPPRRLKKPGSAKQKFI